MGALSEQRQLLFARRLGNSAVVSGGDRGHRLDASCRRDSEQQEWNGGVHLQSDVGSHDTDDADDYNDVYHNLDDYADDHNNANDHNDIYHLDDHADDHNNANDHNDVYDLDDYADDHHNADDHDDNLDECQWQVVQLDQPVERHDSREPGAEPGQRGANLLARAERNRCLRADHEQRSVALHRDKRDGASHSAGQLSHL